MESRQCIAISLPVSIWAEMSAASAAVSLSHSLVSGVGLHTPVALAVSISCNVSSGVSAVRSNVVCILL